jgi:hypothetical protein
MGFKAQDDSGTVVPTAHAVRDMADPGKATHHCGFQVVASIVACARPDARKHRREQ